MSRSQGMSFGNGTIRTRSRVTENESRLSKEKIRERSKSRGENNMERMRLNEIVRGKHVLDG